MSLAITFESSASFFDSSFPISSKFSAVSASPQATKSSNDEIPAWVEELKTTFRETKDVYMDGTKVTSVIKSKVSKVGSNTYAI